MAGKYQKKYWDYYLEYVKKCLARDGYSNSDSSAKTAAIDTFYLERNDAKDFMSWFENPESVKEAKNRVAYLLSAAGRKSSNLATDIKYYSRDIDYFAEYIWGLRGNSFAKDDLDSEYVFVRELQGKNNVKIVKSKKDNQLYVRKEYKIYNRTVFDRLKEAKIEGIPEICEIEEKNGILYTTEKYIDGINLLEVFKKDGCLGEEQIGHLALEICKILHRLHTMTPQILHRDIKPSNIMYGSDGHVYLIDFNASKEYRENVSGDTILYGTPYFAAPEQLLGYGASSAATDIFGLGATLHYLMTGVYIQNYSGGGKYKKVFSKCTEMSSKERYQTIEELVQALLWA